MFESAKLIMSLQAATVEFVTPVTGFVMDLRFSVEPGVVDKTIAYGRISESTNTKHKIATDDYPIVDVVWFTPTADDYITQTKLKGSDQNYDIECNDLAQHGPLQARFYQYQLEETRTDTLGRFRSGEILNEPYAGRIIEIDAGNTTTVTGVIHYVLGFSLLSGETRLGDLFRGVSDRTIKTARKLSGLAKLAARTVRGYGWLVSSLRR
jgi:hypothetical protein